MLEYSVSITSCFLLLCAMSFILFLMLVWYCFTSVSNEQVLFMFVWLHLLSFMSTFYAVLSNLCLIQVPLTFVWWCACAGVCYISVQWCCFSFFYIVVCSYAELCCNVLRLEFLRSLETLLVLLKTERYVRCIAGCSFYWELSGGKCFFIAYVFPQQWSGLRLVNFVIVVIFPCLELFWN